jgi:hypothetical protein
LSLRYRVASGASAYLKNDLLKPYWGREWCEVAISKALGATTPNQKLAEELLIGKRLAIPRVVSRANRLATRGQIAAAP